ncbi:hypothetical protein CHUAL_000290 [Chamberlinius hualienensis]
MEKQAVLNFNVGVVGHIDSGKTSLAKVLSTTSSTASFDKNPQSQERGITLDLGFSSFSVDFPDQLKNDSDCFNYKTLQFTLVDCPGHASLIKTIIGGSQIIDMMLLVVDASKGIQTQTAECLVLGEITTSKMVVVINKVDLYPEDKRSTMIERMQKRLWKTLERTKFANCPIIAVSAKPGGPEGDNGNAVGIEDLITTLCKVAYVPKRSPDGPFIFAVDHCFSIQGPRNNFDRNSYSWEHFGWKQVRKVKTIQMFRKARNSAIQGDRVGICVTQFDPKLIERGLVCSPGDLPVLRAAIATVNPISYYKGNVLTKAKFHISLGHETVMAVCTFFGNQGEIAKMFDMEEEYHFQDSLIVKQTDGVAENALSANNQQFALLQFEHPVAAPPNCLIIGSKLDTDIHQNSCRLAFEGRLVNGIQDKTYVETILPQLKIYKIKQKEGIVERLLDDYTVIAKSLFKKETNIQSFANMKVKLSTGEDGLVEGSFGQSGKVKIRIPGGLNETALASLKSKKKSKDKPDIEATPENSIRVILTFKRYIFDPKKRLIQT